MSLNIIILALKLANIWHSDPILEHFLHLGQKCITMKTGNLKYDMTRTNFPEYRLILHASVFEKFTRNSRKQFFQKNALADLI